MKPSRGSAAALLLLSALGCRDTLRFDPAAIAGHRMLEGAPPGFLLGAASSAYQIEGGNRNDWTDWEKGRYPDGTLHVADGLTADRLGDSWNRWPQDIAALRLLGANVDQLSQGQCRRGRPSVGSLFHFKLL